MHTEVLFFRQHEMHTFVRFQDYNGEGGLLSFEEFKRDKPYLAHHDNRYFVRLF
jgi:hypothetical protein